MVHDTKEAEDLFESNNTIKLLNDKIVELNSIIALKNEDKISSKDIKKLVKLSTDEINLEAFTTGGDIFTRVIVSKHADSDYVNITFIPNEGKVLRIYMTEKSYLKFNEVINVFKLKSINTKQLEEN
jgi:hypothetical protein